MSLQQIPLDQIRAAENQPRKTFYEESLTELAASIKERGVLEPIVVRPMRGENAGLYEIVMGERRYRASRIAGSTTIPAVVRDMSDDDALADALLENFQREDLNPVEKAHAVQGLLQIMSREKVCQTLGVSETTIRRILELLELPVAVQSELITRQGSGQSIFTEGHARALIVLNHDPSLQKQLMLKVKEEKMSVARLEQMIEAIKKYPGKSRIFLHVPAHVADQMMRSLGSQEERRKPFKAQTAHEHVKAIDKQLSQVLDLLDDRVVDHLSTEQMNQLLASVAQAEDYLEAFNTRVRETLKNQSGDFREKYMHCPLCGRIELVNTVQCAVCYSTLKRCIDCGFYNKTDRRCNKRLLPVSSKEAEFPTHESVSAKCTDYEPRFVPQTINLKRVTT